MLLRHVCAGLVVPLTLCCTVLVALAAALLLKLDPAFVMLNHVLRMTLIHLAPAVLPRRLLREQPSR